MGETAWYVTLEMLQSPERSCYWSDDRQDFLFICRLPNLGIAWLVSKSNLLPTVVVVEYSSHSSRIGKSGMGC